MSKNRPVSRLLVVDASVVMSAGETSHPVSAACRKCLEAIRDICHRVVETSAIRDEWKRHMSRFSRKWRVSMTARRKLPRLAVAAVGFSSDGLSETDRKAIEKDLCLVEAALSADHVIVTRDDAFRSALSKTSQGRRLMASIKWINPVEDGVSTLGDL